MLYKGFAQLFYIGLLIIVTQSVFADGCFVTDGRSEEVYAPDQKVVIVWDGKIQTMILSTKLQSKELANFGWIIPIKSIKKPEVELQDVTIFYELSKYFDPSLKFDSIEMAQTKQLDIYDITVIRAAHSEQFNKWLKYNNFTLPDGAENILNSYMNKDFFFVTVKIDLPNKYEDEVNILKSGMHNPLIISFETDQVFFPLKVSRINSGNVDITMYVFGKNPLKDATSLLRISKWGKVTSHLISKISGYLPVNASQYVSKLNFNGSSSKFVNDISFVEMNPEERERYSEQGIERAKPLKEKLRRAVSDGNIDIVGALIKNGVDIHEKRHGKSLLHIAVERIWNSKNTKEIIRLLLDKGIDINSKDDEGNTPLNYAIKATAGAYVDRHVEVAGFLIKHGGVLGNEKLGRNACDVLMSAAGTGKKSVVELLVNMGVDINRENNHGDLETAMHCAAWFGHIDIVKFLIENGAKIDTRTRGGGSPTPFGGGKTPLVLAVEAGHTEIVRLLLKHETNSSKNKALYHAAKMGNIEIIKILLESGADPDIPIGRMDLLLEIRTDLGMSLGQMSLLSLAAARGDMKTLKTLIEGGADPDGTGSSETPLTVAVIKGNLEIVEYLIKNGADINGTNINRTSKTPLDLALEADNRDLTKYLITKGITLYSTHLYNAIKRNDTEMVKLFIDVGSMPISFKSSKYLLKTAFEKENLKIVEYLIKNGADTNISFGRVSLIGKAKELGYKEIVKLAKLYGGLENDYNIPRTASKEKLKSGMTIQEVLLRFDVHDPMYVSCPPSDEKIMVITDLGHTEHIYLIFKKNILIKFGSAQVLAKHINENLEAYLEGQKAQDIEDKKTYVDYLPPNGIYKTKKEIVRAYEDSVKDPWNGFFELRLPISFGVMSSSPFPKQAEDDNSKPGSLLVVHSRYTTVRIYAREREKRLDDLDIDEARKNLTKNKDTNILMIRHIIINGVKGIEYLMDFKGRLLHRITFWKKGVGHTIIITSHPNNYKKDIYAIVELISNYKGKNAE